MQPSRITLGWIGLHPPVEYKGVKTQTEREKERETGKYKDRQSTTERQIVRKIQRNRKKKTKVRKCIEHDKKEDSSRIMRVKRAY